MRPASTRHFLPLSRLVTTLTGEPLPFVNALRYGVSCWGCGAAASSFHSVCVAAHRRVNTASRRACYQGRGTTQLAPSDPTAAGSRKNSPNTTPPAAFPRIISPSTPQDGDFGPFFVRWANYFALTPTIRPSRANFFAHGPPPMGTLKPTTPLRAPEQQPLKPPSPLLAPKQRPLKPPSPLQPKNAPKTPISHPQRR